MLFFRSVLFDIDISLFRYDILSRPLISSSFVSLRNIQLCQVSNASVTRQPPKCRDVASFHSTLPVVSRGKQSSAARISYVLQNTLYTGACVSQRIVPAIFFSRLYGLFTARGERLPRIRRGPELTRGIHRMPVARYCRAKTNGLFRYQKALSFNARGGK